MKCLGRQTDRILLLMSGQTGGGGVLVRGVLTLFFQDRGHRSSTSPVCEDLACSQLDCVGFLTFSHNPKTHGPGKLVCLNQGPSIWSTGTPGNPCFCSFPAKMSLSGREGATVRSVWGP